MDRASMRNMRTQSEFIALLKGIPREVLLGGTNNEIFTWLMIEGQDFHKVESVEELENMPLGSLLFDKDFKTITAQEATPERPDNDEQTFKERGPLFVVYVPDPVEKIG